MTWNLRALSIKARITAVAVATTMLALLAASSIFFFNQMTATRASIVSSATALARISAINVGPALAFHDRSAAGEIAAALAHETGILVVEIFLTDGTLFASARTSDATRQKFADKIIETDATRKSELEALRSGAASFHTYEEGYIDLTHRIDVGGEMVGHLDLVVDDAELRTQMTRQLGFAVLVFGGSLLVAYLLASWLQRFISAPLVDLAAMMGEVSRQGDYSLRARKTTRDEAGVLVDGFNTMLGQIQGRDTALAQAVSDLRVAKSRADEANAAKSDFLAVMSHEIRTPMNGVIGMIDVLEQSNLRSAQAEIVKVVKDSAFALLSIVDDVLDFSKIEAGRLHVDVEPMDIKSVVEGVRATLDRLAVGRDVVLSVATDATVPATVLGDGARLRQVLINLVGNAIKFSSVPGHQGRVAVQARVVEDDAEHRSLEFTVSDNGIGMNEEVLARLFTAFSQGDSSTTRRFGGTGLGLSISRRLVGLMGGEIGVISEPGRGSIFTVRLPLRLPDSPEGRDDACGHAPSSDMPLEVAAGICNGPGSGLHDIGKVAKFAFDTGPTPLAGLQMRAPGGLILVAEDNEINQMVVLSQLSLFGFTADVASNGCEALACWRAGNYALLLTDLNMPEMDGYALTAAIREAEAGRRRMPILALTANALPSEAKRCRDLGMDGYLTKPIQTTELIDALVKWLPAGSFPVSAHALPWDAISERAS